MLCMSETGQWQAGSGKKDKKGETTAPESLEQLFWNSRHCTLASGNCRPEDGKHDLAIFTLFLWVILRLHFPTVYTVDRMPSGPVLTEIQAIWHTFASNSICQAWMLYDCPSVGTTVQYSHMAVTRQISYSRVFAQGKGYIGNLQGKYNAENQSSGVLIIRSFLAQVLCNIAWIPCYLVNSCNGQQSGPAVSVAPRRWKVL